MLIGLLVTWVFGFMCYVERGWVCVVYVVWVSCESGFVAGGLADIYIILVVGYGFECLNLPIRLCFAIDYDFCVEVLT